MSDRKTEELKEAELDQVTGGASHELREHVSLTYGPGSAGDPETSGKKPGTKIDGFQSSGGGSPKV